MNDKFERLMTRLLSAYQPDERLTVSQWSDKYRHLSSASSSEPGRWRTSRTPYLKEIMDKLSSTDPTEEVIFMKGAQIGATEAGFNWVGYVIDVCPGPMLMVQPTDEMCKRNSKQRFDPMVEATVRLQEKIKQKRSRDSGNTLLQKDFPGGTIILTGANSAVGLRSMPVKYLFLDEVDGYPQDLDGEGSPVSLAEARTRTFSRRKVFKCSTPTTDARSVIAKEFEKTDQRFYEVPCPHCGTFQRLEWQHLKWEPRMNSDQFDVWYQCPECNGKILNGHKTKMLESGQWVAYNTDATNPKKTGYHLSSLYSPVGWFSWDDAVNQFIKSQKDPALLKSFINTILGETWKDKGEAPEWQGLYDRRENYEFNRPPVEVALITAGVDVQKDRIEIEIVGWSKGKVSHSLDYRVIQGDTSGDEVWNKLAVVVNEQWERSDGRMMPLSMMAVDSGYNTSKVYDFCRRFDTSRVVPVKGHDTLDVMAKLSSYIDTSEKGKHTQIRVWHVGSSKLKEELYGYLRQRIDENGTIPPGYCHFPQYGADYFKGITAESIQFKEVKGRRLYTWVKHFDRNEPLDCRNYARAAASIKNMDRFTDNHWHEMQQNAGVNVVRRAPAKRQRSESYW